MSSTTANFGFTKPAVNSSTDADQWGTEINTDLDSIDSQLFTRTKDYDFAGYKLKNAQIINVSETAYNLGSTLSGSLAVDYTNGDYQYGTLTGNVTAIAISNAPATGQVGSLTLELRQDGTGSRTLALLNTVYRSSGGSAITLTTTASATDKLRLETRDGGTTWDVYLNSNMKLVP